MERSINYLVKMEGNEALLERFIEAINNGTCTTHPEYPNPYLLATGELFINIAVIDYFFQTRPFNKALYIDFFERLRQLEPTGFHGYSHSIRLWIEARITNKFFKISGERWNKTKTLLPGMEVSAEEMEILSFMCYVAVCHIKYGSSYETVTANNYFDIVTQLGSGEVARLKENGTGTLPKALTEYKDDDLTCSANDVFATIIIRANNDSEETYRKALHFINNLLPADFPKSYEIQFISLSKKQLPIAGLPKCGQHTLFAGAVRYPALHTDIITYLNLAMRQDEWYNNLEEEDCAMPGTFAAFALGMESEAYFDKVIDYLQQVDDEHQSIQQKLTPAFIEKYGVTPASIKVYINCIMSMQGHDHDPRFIAHFTTDEALQLLLTSKENFIAWYFTKEDLEQYEESGSDLQEKADYCWDCVMDTTFGDASSQDTIAARLTDSQRAMFEQLRVEL